MATVHWKEMRMRDFEGAVGSRKIRGLPPPNFLFGSKDWN